jgi:hypothetical protein
MGIGIFLEKDIKGVVLFIWIFSGNEVIYRIDMRYA